MRHIFLWCLLAICADSFSAHAQNNKPSELKVKATVKDLRGEGLEKKLKEVVTANAATASQKFIIDGKLKFPKAPAMAHLNYWNETGMVTDSAMVQDGVFTFTGSFTGMMEARIKLNHLSGSISSAGIDVSQVFYLEPDTVSVVSETDSIKHARIHGGALNQVNNEYQALLRPAMIRSDLLWAEIVSKTSEERKDPDFVKANKARRAAIDEEIKATNKQFYKDHPDAYPGLVAFKGFVDVNNHLEETEAIFNRFSPEVKNTWLGKLIASQIAGARSTQTGLVAMDFTQNDVNGKPVKLSDFRGKYVLLDFWASWCLPCRKENPYLVKAYNDYKNKNFTVLSVSLDKADGRNAWLKAIEKDGLTWTHISDLRYWENAVAVQYGVKSVPANYLIDPQGRIIARNLRGEELHAKLAELLH